jgi:hypothetical protein
MVPDFWPGDDSWARWVLLPGAIFSSDCVDFMPEPEPRGSVASFRFIGAADGAPRSDPIEPPPVDGADWAGAPPVEPPLICALATPLPAINAAAATDIRKRLVIVVSSDLFCPPINLDPIAAFRGTLGSTRFVF